MRVVYRNGLIGCLLGAACALGAALAIAGFRVLELLRRTVEIFSGDRGDPIPGPDLTAAWLALLAVLLLAGAVGFALAGRRVALALERASLIDLS